MRLVLHRYPWIRGRGALARLLGVARLELPAGEVVRSRYGTRFRVMGDEMYRELVLFGEYEPRQSALYCGLVRAGDVVFDVGANFGWFATLFAGLVGPTGRVHAFEPVPAIAALTEEALELNRCADRVDLWRVGLGSSRGHFTVYTFDGLPHGHASATKLGRPDARPHRCDLTTLDDHVRERGVRRVDLLKMDVEGHELEVLRGARDTLSGPDAPLIVLEMNQDCMRDRGLRADDLRSTLRDLGYTHLWRVRRTDDYLAAKPHQEGRVRRARRGHLLVRA